MITCSNCGELVPAGTASCRRCGMPLSSMVGSAADYDKVAPQQPELPAWLESLRAGERGAPSGGGQTNFSAADLVEEGNLPSWMQSTRSGDTPDSGLSGPQVAWRPAASPAPDTGAGFLPDSQGITANSLIDEQALPIWMRENQSTYPGGLQQGEPHQAGQRNIAASSLVQPDSLPDWMRSLQQQQPPLAPTPAPSPFMQRPELNTPMESLAAQDLIDQQQLPSWMSGNNPAAAASGNQANLNASSLLDMNSLPPWLRENNQAQRPANASFQPPAMHPTPPTAGANSNLTGASLIDMNALPEWLRSSVDQQTGSGQMGNPRQAPFSGPPRVENMRVPSRPRSEVGMHEQSEAAANVFASMLGVASAAPNLPALPMNDAYGRPLQAPQEQSVQPMGVPPQMISGMGNPVQGTPPVFGGPPPSPGGYQGGYMLGNQPGGMPSPYPMGTPQEPAAAGQPKAQTKPAKRSFLDAIRDWFSR